MNQYILSDCCRLIRFSKSSCHPSLRALTVLIMFASVHLTNPVNSSAENWTRFTGTDLKLPGSNGTTISGYSESYYDSDSIRRLGDYRVEIWLKDMTFLGDLEPHIHKELLRIDCSGNRFVSLVESDQHAAPERLHEINSGIIGDGSPYRKIREAVCGY